MGTIVERLAAFEGAITTDELAAVWGMKPWTVRDWVRRKRLPAYKMGNEWRIDPADAIKFWQQRRVGR
jgi:excisionase family DNA binding protein